MYDSNKKSMLFVLSTTRVTNSRFFKRQNTVWRRRQTSDGVVFTTRETLDFEQVLVINKSGQINYKPGKLYLSLLKACDHMDEAEDVAWQIKNTVEEKMIGHLQKDLSIDKDTLSTICIETLKQFNTTAYIKYASTKPELVSARKLSSALR